MQKENSNDNFEKKVGGYARVSTLEQAEKGTSIDEQKRIIHGECLRRGWQLVQIYCDEGASGNLTDRQGLHDLQRDARLGLFQTIVFTKSDRLTRSIRDLTNLWHDWTKLGLEIISVEQPEINSRGIYGKMLRNLLGIFAEWERDAIIERTTSGRMARWRTAEAIMGTLPYGYEFDRINRNIVLHPEKSIICQRIFRMYLHQNLNTREIASRLYKESIPTPQNRHCRWQYATISSLLKNPAYAGRSEYNIFKFETKKGKMGQQFSKRSKEKKDSSQWITIDFPSIISLKSHLKILDRMKLGSELFHRCRKSESYKNLYLLENIRLFCGECGKRLKMHIVSKKRDKPDVIYTYYRCHFNNLTRKELASRYQTHLRCDMRVDAKVLDSFVFGQIMEFLDSTITVARRELTELSLKKILDRARSCRTTPFSGHALIQPEQWPNSKISGWEFTKCDEDDLKCINCLVREKYSASSESMKRILDLDTRRCDQVCEYDFGVRKIGTKRLIKQEMTSLSTELSNYINGMTFQQKKRIVESVLAPENGGKCIIKWARSFDHSHSRQDTSSKEKSHFFRGAFRTEPQFIQITFLLT